MVNMFSPADTNSYTTVQPDYIPAALKYTNKSDDVATVDKVIVCVWVCGCGCVGVGVGG